MLVLDVCRYHEVVRDGLNQLILGIESSCDETSAAVVRGGREVLSNVVASQMVHGDYGGVVPELASREHLRAIVPVVREAMRQAGAGYHDLAALAVTEGPGLAGALLVGITFAKAAAFAAERPLIAVNHLEGHIHAVLMDAAGTLGGADRLMTLVVSGGHTHLYLAERDGEGAWRYGNVGKTLDDAAGEAYDKAAKLLGLPYPGGPWMDALAAHGDPLKVPFRFAQIKTKHKAKHKIRHEARHETKRSGEAAPKLPGSAGEELRFDVSFSGIKTAVRRYVETHAMAERIAARTHAMRRAGLINARPREAMTEVLPLLDRETLDVIASFQASVTGYLTRTLFAAAEQLGARAVLVSGGVAANGELRRRVREEAARRGLPVAFPSIALSTDNAAMIAAAAWPKFVAGRFAEGTLEPVPQLRLGWV